jgi:hypothetical protein
MNTTDSSWSIYRIGGLCQLHLLRKRYRPGDDIIGIMEFNSSKVVCVKYRCTLECDATKQVETKEEFTFGFKRNDFSITIPEMTDAHGQNGGGQVLNYVIKFLFYITNANFTKTLFEDKAGITELGPKELDSKQFMCNFAILIYT